MDSPTDQSSSTLRQAIDAVFDSTFCLRLGRHIARVGFSSTVLALWQQNYVSLGSSCLLLLGGWASSMTVSGFKRHPGYAQLDREAKFWLVLCHVVGGGFLLHVVEWMCRHRVQSWSFMLRDAEIAMVQMWCERSFDRMVSGLWSRCVLAGHLIWTVFFSWCSLFAKELFPLCIFLGGIWALAPLTVDENRPFPYIVLVIVCSASQFAAAVGHWRSRTILHQTSLSTTGLGLAGLSVYLWISGVHPHAFPPVLGLIGGFVFGMSIPAWQIAASRDPNAERRSCRAVSGICAATGVAVVALNIFERRENPALNAEAIASLWPIFITLSASLAAFCPRDWDVGSSGSKLNYGEASASPNDNPDKPDPDVVSLGRDSA